MGLQSANTCYCGNIYGMERPAAATDCDTDGVVEDGGIADQCGDGQIGTCQNQTAVLESTRSTCPTGAPTCGSAAAPATRCAAAADQSCCCETNNNAHLNVSIAEPPPPIFPSFDARAKWPGSIHPIRD